MPRERRTRPRKVPAESAGGRGCEEPTYPVVFSRDTPAIEAARAHPAPVLLRVEREDVHYAMWQLVHLGRFAKEEPLHLLEAGRLALEFFASAFGDHWPELREVSGAFGAALDRHRSKEAPDLDRAFKMPPADGKRRRQAWHDRPIEFRGSTWHAGSAAWALYVEALKAGQTEIAACEEIGRTLGAGPLAVRKYLREVRGHYANLFPEQDVTRPKHPGRPRKSTLRES